MQSTAGPGPASAGASTTPTSLRRPGGPSDDGDNRSRNAKAQRRHREKRKAHFKAVSGRRTSTLCCSQCLAVSIGGLTLFLFFCFYSFPCAAYVNVMIFAPVRPTPTLLQRLRRSINLLPIPHMSHRANMVTNTHTHDHTHTCMRPLPTSCCH